MEWIVDVLDNNSNRVTHLTGQAAYDNAIKIIKDWAKEFKTIESVELFSKATKFNGVYKPRMLTIATKTKTYYYQFIVGEQIELEVIKEYEVDCLFGDSYTKQDFAYHKHRKVRLERVYTSGFAFDGSNELLFDKLQGGNAQHD